MNAIPPHGAWRHTNAALLALGLAGPAWSTSTTTFATTAPAMEPNTDCDNAPQPLRPVASGVWVWEGQPAEIGPDNAGHVVSNVVLSTDGPQPEVTVVDPGPSLRHGQALARAIRCQLNGRVVRLVDSHAHAENVLANGAFVPPDTVRITRGTSPSAPSMPSEQPVPAVWATATTAAVMAERCPDCLQSLTDRAGAVAMAGTRIVLPTQTLPTQGQRHWGNATWAVQAWPQAHSHSDLTLWHAEQRVLIAAGLVYQQRLPELAQGTLRGWLQALDQLTTLQPRMVIGQNVGGPETLLATRGYLCDLSRSVWQAMEQGWSATEAENLALPAYAHWAGYAQRQGFNAQRAWRELEPDWMSGELPPCSTPDVGR